MVTCSIRLTQFSSNSRTERSWWTRGLSRSTNRVLTQRRDARWSPSPPAGLVRSARALTLMLGSKPGMLSLSLTSHCVYVAHGSRAAPGRILTRRPQAPRASCCLQPRGRWAVRLAQEHRDPSIRPKAQDPEPGRQHHQHQLERQHDHAFERIGLRATKAAVDAITRTLAKELAAQHPRESDQPRDGRDGRPAYRRLRRERVSETDRCWTYQA